MGTLAQVVTAIQALVANVSGIREAPSTPPENMHDFPFAVCIPLRGDWNRESYGTCTTKHHTFRLTVHVARASLPHDYTAIIGYGDTVPAALLADQTLTSTVDTVDALRWELGAVEYGDAQTLAWTFDIDTTILPV